MNAPQQAVPTFSSVFAARLLGARTRAGLTQQQLADMVGVSQQAITQWESGQALPRNRRRNAVADVLGIDLSDTAVAEVMRGQTARVIWEVATPSLAAELLMAELIIATIVGVLPTSLRTIVDEQLTKIGVAGTDAIRSQERRAAIAAGGAA